MEQRSERLEVRGNQKVFSNRFQRLSTVINLEDRKRLGFKTPAIQRGEDALSVSAKAYSTGATSEEGTLCMTARSMAGEEDKGGSATLRAPKRGDGDTTYRRRSQQWTAQQRAKRAGAKSSPEEFVCGLSRTTRARAACAAPAVPAV